MHFRILFSLHYHLWQVCVDISICCHRSDLNARLVSENPYVVVVLFVRADRTHVLFRVILANIQGLKETVGNSWDILNAILPFLGHTQ